MSKQLFLMSLLLGLVSTTQPVGYIDFAMGSFNKLHTVGTVFPCSSYTAHELCAMLPELQEARPEGISIIELGAGDGAVSRVIVESYLRPQDKLVLIEIDEDFAEDLRMQFEAYKNVTVICGDVLDHAPEKSYDAVICTLPFNAFSLSLTRSLIEKIKTFVCANGYFSRVEYAFWPTIRYYSYFVIKSRARRTDFGSLLAYMRELDEQYEVDHSLVFRNVPPLHVRHLQFSK